MLHVQTGRCLTPGVEVQRDDPGEPAAAEGAGGPRFDHDGGAVVAVDVGDPPDSVTFHVPADHATSSRRDQNRLVRGLGHGAVAREPWRTREAVRLVSVAGVDDPHDSDLRADDEGTVDLEGERRGEALLASVGRAGRAQARVGEPRVAEPGGLPGPSFREVADRVESGRGTDRRKSHDSSGSGLVHRQELRQPCATCRVVDEDATVVVPRDGDVPAVRADSDRPGRKG